MRYDVYPSDGVLREAEETLIAVQSRARSCLMDMGGFAKRMSRTGCGKERFSYYLERFVARIHFSG